MKDRNTQDRSIKYLLDSLRGQIELDINNNPEAALSNIANALDSATTEPQVAEALNNLGMTYLKMKKHDEAKEYIEWAIGIFKKTYGEDSQWVAGGLNNIGYIYFLQNKYHDALKMGINSAAIFKRCPEVDERFSHFKEDVGTLCTKYLSKMDEYGQELQKNSTLDKIFLTKNYGIIAMMEETSSLYSYLREKHGSDPYEYLQDFPQVYDLIAKSIIYLGRTYAQYGLDEMAFEKFASAMELKDKFSLEMQHSLRSGLENTAEKLESLGAPFFGIMDRYIPHQDCEEANPISDNISGDIDPTPNDI